MVHLQRRGVAADDFSIRPAHRISDFAEGGVVPDQEGYGQVFIDRCAQFTGRELQATVADQAHHGRAGGRYCSTYGGTGAKTQCAKASGGVEPPPCAVVVVVQVARIDRLGAIAHDQRLWQRTADRLDHL